MVKHVRWPLRQLENLVVEFLLVIDEGGALTKILYSFHFIILYLAVITEEGIKWVFGFDGRYGGIEIYRIIEDFINKFSGGIIL